MITFILNFDSDSQSGKCLEDERILIYQGTPDNPQAKLIDVLCGSTTSMPSASVPAVIGQHAHATIIFKTGSRSRSPNPDSGVWNGFLISWTI